MKYETNEIRVSLAPKTSLKISSGAGCTVRCLRGALWITQHNDSADLFVRDSKTVVLDRPGLAIVTAGEESLVEVVCADDAVEVRPLPAPRVTVRQAPSFRFASDSL